MLLFSIKDDALELYSFSCFSRKYILRHCFEYLPHHILLVSHGFKERIVKYWLANFKVHVHPLLPPRTLEQVRKNRGKN